LNKNRQKQKLINKIRKNNEEFSGQEEVSKCIKDFYTDLYKKQQTTQEEDEAFYVNCPKLPEKEKKFMDESLTLADLQAAMATCKESMPGPDGIPYIVYKKFWKQTGQIILDAWNYSILTGNLAPSHVESVITLLPKDGKDKRDIKNWRPITLSNCDSKIITKAVSIKMSKVLDLIIDSSQTAYVPGRSVMDNLRANFYVKGQCKKKNTNSVLISLDAKKAFDSVDHSYIKRTLEAYGFGEHFIRTFQILYNDISARILVNGYTTEPIKIERGVKQGDALSCSIFIICIDPLLRNLNRNKEIVEIKTRAGAGFKAAAYADDISIVCKNSATCIQQVFREYERLTNLSGLELNADKTEILSMNSDEEKTFQFVYNKQRYCIRSVRKIKICGLFYCTEEKEEYEKNVVEKHEKLRVKIRVWSHRNLTLEGKILIVKTFGLSQLIYNMQSYNFKKADLTMIERSIFGFLWSTSEHAKGIDRIKRSILKNDFPFGGLNVTDVECLNRALKLKQFIRSNESNHEMSNIQHQLSGSKHLLREYEKITSEEAICESAQETINIITQHNRLSLEDKRIEEYEHDKLMIDDVSSINLATYLKNKKKLFHLCMLKPLTSEGIETLGDLVQAYEYEQNQKTLQSMKNILGTFRGSLVNIAKCFNENTNVSSRSYEYMMITQNSWSKISEITVKQLQVTLKIALNRVECLNVNEKLNITNFDNNFITIVRQRCKNTKLRSIYFRLIHNDFFTHKRMKRFNMTNSDQCPRCGEIEDMKHLLWECQKVKPIWDLYNQVMQSVKVDKVTSYEDIFVPGENEAVCNIKIKLIQEMIQIERPKNWNIDNIKKMIVNMANMENFMANKNNNLNKYKIKWNQFNTILQT